MAANGKGAGGDLGAITPSTGGKRGGLVVVLVLAVVLVLVLAFLYASERQKTSGLQKDLDHREQTIKNLTAERDQALLDVSRLRTSPAEAEAEIRSLNETITELQKQASFAEMQRADVADLLIEAQRENAELKTAVAEMESRLRQAGSGEGNGEE